MFHSRLKWNNTPRYLDNRQTDAQTGQLPKTHFCTQWDLNRVDLVKF